MPLRIALSDALVSAAVKDPRVLLLTGDHGYALFDDFRRKCPDQYLNAGIAEQNMVGVAAGLAKAGYRPIVYGLSAFVPIRVLEQIKLDICYESLPVLFLGDGAGMVYSKLGASHQSAEDIAALRAIPGITILSPADRWEMQACFDYAFSTNEPVYLRVGKSDVPPAHDRPVTIASGELLPVQYRQGDLVWIATGSMVSTAIEAAKCWSGSAVFSAPCVKPLKTESLVDVCRHRRAVITLEEHSIYGGLGSAVTEILSQNLPRHVLRIGVEDQFAQFCGSHSYLLEQCGLSAPAVEQRVAGFLRRHFSEELEGQSWRAA